MPRSCIWSQAPSYVAHVSAACFRGWVVGSKFDPLRAGATVLHIWCHGPTHIGHVSAAYFRDWVVGGKADPLRAGQTVAQIGPLSAT